MGHGELNLGILAPCWTQERLPRTTNGPQVVEPAGRSVDCLGLTKRWSLYVPPFGKLRVPARTEAGRINPNSPVV
jgi:hypothetical protein